MHKNLLFILVCLLFVACSSKSTEERKKFDNFNLFTQKSDILENSNPKILLFSTYLNNLKQSFDKNYENFIVSTYLVNENSQNIFQKGYTFLLNGKELFYKEELKEGMPMYKKYKLKNNWGKYYYLKFKKVDSTNLTLEFKNKNSNVNELIKFEKN